MHTNFATLEMIAERRYEPMATSSEFDHEATEPSAEAGNLHPGQPELSHPVAETVLSPSEPAAEQTPELTVVDGGSVPEQPHRRGRGRYRRQRKSRLRLSA